jgi:hypothetical protein
MSYQIQACIPSYRDIGYTVYNGTPRHIGNSHNRKHHIADRCILVRLDTVLPDMASTGQHSRASMACSVAYMDKVRNANKSRYLGLKDTDPEQ